jgi:hypothetical protein
LVSSCGSSGQATCGGEDLRDAGVLLRDAAAIWRAEEEFSRTMLESCETLWPEARTSSRPPEDV